MSAAERRVEHVTCLGCGCTCDDVTVIVRDDRIVALERACPLGAAWFGDGSVPTNTLVAGQATTVEEAIAAAARMLAAADRPLVFVADDVSCETQREAVGVADRLHAMLDTASSGTVLPSVLGAQRRGRAGATFGEIRNRGDVVVFWGVDPAVRYPRYMARVTPEPPGMHLPGGARGGRTVVAVDVGDANGPAGADRRIRFDAGDDENALALVRAAVLGRRLAASGIEAAAAELATLMMAARYVVIVHDAEPSPATSPGTAEALIALAEALNGPTRCALSTLRSGGNRSGADAVLTWRTGFPLSVDFARGAPRYRPLDGAAALLARREIDAALIVGAIERIPAQVVEPLREVRCAIVGPRASVSGLGAAVAIDTGVAGIHEGGLAVRADDVPLPLRVSIVGGPVSALTVMRALGAHLSAASRKAAGAP